MSIAGMSNVPFVSGHQKCWPSILFVHTAHNIVLFVDTIMVAVVAALRSLITKKNFGGRETFARFEVECSRMRSVYVTGQ